MNPTAADLNAEVKKRRTFAIISHPDAGKTTLTEKLLLYGGAIHLAGAVKAKKNQRHTTSDWMDIEQQRGISISASVLQFFYEGCHVNLLDTPGHKDFSEDTYRTLMAADAAVMLIDGAKGVEPQTIKLFEVCRMRGIPIFTFINKMDRPSQEPIDLLDELEKVLGIRSCPVTWPIGMGDRFKGVFDRQKGDVLLYSTDRANATTKLKPHNVTGIEDPFFTEILAGEKKDHFEGKELHEKLIEEIELLEVAGDEYDLERIRNGQLTPVFFGSAMNNFGVERFLEHFLKMAPAPVPRTTAEGTEISPSDPAFSGFVFKIQANMDPSHRDRVAFIRICSGKFEKGMNSKHARLKKDYKLTRPLHFFAQERVIVEEAWPGDIVGLVDTNGSLRIGDTLYTGKKPIEYVGVPSFSPEHFSGVQILDPLKRKQLQKGLDQLSEEGVIQLYRQIGLGDKDPVLGAVGALQFEVLQSRLKEEYKVDIKLIPLPYTHARWVSGENFTPSLFEREDSRCLEDRDGKPVVLFKSQWALNWAIENHKGLTFKTSGS